MRKLCIINQKGGVGKTTTSVALAYGLAQQGKRTLLIDMDPQGNISSSLPIDQHRKDMYHIFVENANPLECIQNVVPNLDIIPSNETLTKVELLMVAEKAREYILQRKLKKIKGYDYVLIDCAPSLGLLNQNVMLYSSEAVIPVSCDYLGVEAMHKMMSAINSINDVFCHELHVTKIIPTLYDGRLKIAKESLMTLQNEFYEKVTSPIRMNSKLKEAPKEKKSIFELARSSNGAKDYAAVIKSILQDDPNAEATTQIAESQPEQKIAA